MRVILQNDYFTSRNCATKIAVVDLALLMTFKAKNGEVAATGMVGEANKITIIWAKNAKTSATISENSYMKELIRMFSTQEDILINLVAQIVFDHIGYFSPRALRGLDNHSTVTNNGKGDRDSINLGRRLPDEIQNPFLLIPHCEKCGTLCRYVSHDLVNDIMRLVNNADYHCFNLEGSIVAVDLNYPTVTKWNGEMAG